MPTQRVLVAGGGGDQALERLWLERTLGAQYELVDVDELRADRIAQLLDAGDASVVLLHVAEADIRERALLLTQLLERKPNIWPIALAEEDDKRVMLAAIRAGARDFVVVGSDGGELRDALERSRRTGIGEHPDGGNQLLALVCARPDIETTTLAVHLALAIVDAAPPSERTLLVDLGFPSADSLVFLDLKPTYSFADAARSVRRFDETLIETAFTRHPSGLSVLPRPEDPAAMQEVNPADVLALFGVLQRYFTRIVVNLAGMRVNDTLVQILNRACRGFLLVDQSLLGCGAARRFVEALHEKGTDLAGLGVIIDRHSKQLTPGAERIAELVGLRLALSLPPCGVLMVRAMNAGASMFDLAPKSPYALAVRAFAREIVGAEESIPRQARWLHWLRRWTG